MIGLLLNTQIVVSLMNFLLFQFVEPTGKRFLLALDVSGSMDCSVLGSTAITAREASAAMAMVTARKEANYHIVGFSDELVPIDITAKMSLGDVVNTIDQVRRLPPPFCVVLFHSLC